MAQEENSLDDIDDIDNDDESPKDGQKAVITKNSLVVRNKFI